eukprot:TRINITY_DN1918_c0_g1_i2.p1 TRINITY_DN1918_c0_g1~~TRINITY_DN1918_c0_g1_i2.p1  ORF type:complete len:223 (+),score=36.04 TRINITY_DN1918_c0_g1_i2:207-875(+)
MSNMPSPSPISTDSEYDGRSSSQADEVTDRRLKPTTDDRVADRRRRNGESAKRSREKRKKFLNEMEENYGTLLESNKSLQDENKRLRELLASVGVDASFPPVQVKDIAPIPELLSSHKTAKRVKRECRVTPTANSFESAVGEQPTGRGDHCTTLDLLSNGDLDGSLERGCTSGFNPNDVADIADLDVDIEWLCKNLADQPEDLRAQLDALDTEFDLAGFVFD